MNLTQERYRRAKEFIPVGVGLLSKKPEAFSPGHKNLQMGITCLIFQSSFRRQCISSAPHH